VKSQKIVTYATVLILGILVFGLLGLIPGVKLQAGGTTAGPAVVGPTGTTIATAPCGQNPPQLTVSAYYVDVNNLNTPTTATTPVSLFNKGDAQAFFASPVAPNTTTTGLLACGSVVVAEFGNQSQIISTGGTSYYRVCKEVTITKDAQALSQELKIVSNASLTIANDSGVFGANTQIDNESIGSGGVYSQWTLRVKAPVTSGSVFGTDGWALCTRFNSSSFAKIWPAGGTAVSIPSVRSTVSKDTVQCYDMTSYGLLNLGKSYDVGLSAQAKSGTVPNNGTNIDFVLVDKAISMQGSDCVVGFTVANDPTSDTGALDRAYINMTEIHSND
jgi:hypothetical protein